MLYLDLSPARFDLILKRRQRNGMIHSFIKGETRNLQIVRCGSY
jgi:hypothetical protein